MSARPGFGRITVGLDDSQASWTALRWAVDQAAATGARIRIVSVPGFAETDTSERAHRLDEAQRFVEREAPGTEVTAEVRRGVVAELLPRLTVDDDLLVVGSHRGRPLRSTFTGSLPEHIATRHDGPTVVVPDDWTFGTGAVVVGVDAEWSQRALEFAARTAARRGRALRVVHARRVPATVGPVRHRFGGGRDTLDDAAVQTDADASPALVLAVAERSARRTAPGVEIDARLVDGDTVSGALATAAVEASLVVVGRRHRTPLGGELLGSVARELVRGSRTPVCIVPDDGN